ncbi:thiamine-phosphate kinase [Pseudarthrobacter sp. AL07]|uniref:thiamine-phosphate kinase n=1 Tax=unclassified Pseudarthrobacter TaxID=2647000 RepID=UPI00249B90D7|nr:MULTISPECIES: thiamine-phosphate kinase [unclassified Pseudarthrobacter]MDI3192910.1 thiamine-phosphate kinase [Pseudarthrobacter sp. AL20]MDI3207271.1 thiamine-phosphate kinase [Pseudarthrobacter sp. AL07]
MPEIPLTEETLTVAALSETELLARIFPRLEMGGNHGSATLLGPGDDAAIVAAPDGRTLISIDTQTQDQDFRLEWNNGYRTTGYDVGWKSAAQNLSDINAMGGRATSLVVSLTMPPGTPVEWVERFADGLTAGIIGLGAADCSVAGGDLGRGREIAVTVAIVGTLGGLPPVLRSGSNPGDTLALAGTVGRAAAGLALLESAVPADTLTAEQRRLMDSQSRPMPPLAAGPSAARAGATAMLDVSDGLVRDGGRLAAASGVVLDLDPAALKPLAEALRPASDLLGADPMAWVLGGGEDHGLLASFPAGVQLPAGFTAIGSVQAPGSSTPPGVTIAGHAVGTGGWDHFAD